MVLLILVDIIGGGYNMAKVKHPLHEGDITYEKYLSTSLKTKYATYVTESLGWKYHKTFASEVEVESYCDKWEEGFDQIGFGVYEVLSRPDDYGKSIES